MPGELSKAARRSLELLAVNDTIPIAASSREKAERRHLREERECWATPLGTQPPGYNDITVDVRELADVADALRTGNR